MKKASSFMLVVLYWLPVIVWMCIIFYLSSRPAAKLSDTFTINFIYMKTLHMFVYGGLFFLIFRAYYRTFSKLKLNTIFLLAISTAILYGVSDELHQTFTPTREGSIRDVLIDTVGILLIFGYTKKYLNKLRFLL